MNAQLKPQMLALTALLSLQTGCCFIPVPRQAVIRPETTLTIQSEDERLLQGAQVRLTRLNEHPHYGDVLGEWDLMSDERGEVRLEHETTRKWVMPLMIHGVGYRMWRACVSHPGYLTRQIALAHDHTLSAEHSVAPLTIKLTPGESTPCPARSSAPQLRQDEAINVMSDQAAAPVTTPPVDAP